MGERITRVNIEHEDGDHDRKGHKNHREEKVLANQRNNKRGGRNDLSDDKEENC